MKSDRTTINSREIYFFSPVYFDTAAWLKLREKILSTLPGNFAAHFYVLDDSAGSDAKINSIKKLPGVTIFEMPRNLGHQRALVFGLRQFLRDEERNGIVVTMDGDGEDDPSHLPRLIEAFTQAQGAEALILAKRSSRSESLAFRLLYLIYKLLFLALTGRAIQTGNYALGSASLFRNIISHPYFDHSYSGTLVAIGPNIHLVPSARANRIEGRSKMSYFGLGLHGIKLLLPFKKRINFRLMIGAFISLAILVFDFGFRSVPQWLLLGTWLALVANTLIFAGFKILIAAPAFWQERRERSHA